MVTRILVGEGEGKGEGKASLGLSSPLMRIRVGVRVRVREVNGEVGPGLAKLSSLNSPIHRRRAMTIRIRVHHLAIDTNSGGDFVNRSLNGAKIHGLFCDGGIQERSRALHIKHYMFLSI